MPTIDLTDDTLFDPDQLITEWEKLDFTPHPPLFREALHTLREAALNHLCDNASGNAFPAFLKAYDSHAQLFATMSLNPDMDDTLEAVLALFRRTAFSGFTLPERENLGTYMAGHSCPNATMR